MNVNLQAVPLIEFGAVTVATILVVAWLQVASINVSKGDDGGLLTYQNGAERAIKPVLAVWATYALTELGVSVSGVVSGLYDLSEVFL